MMRNTNKYLIIAFSFLLFASCEVEDGSNLNGASTSSISTDISRGELINATAGVYADMRTQLTLQVDTQSIFGREYWRFQSSEPRYTGDLLIDNLDNNTFYTTNPYTARYANIKNVNLILQGLENTTADFSDAEISATRGAMNTIKAHELLMVANQQYENGLRLDVDDENNLGEFVDYEDALSAISTLLEEASTDLAAGGDTFPFVVVLGNDLFNTPAGHATFTAALRARVEAYRGNYSLVNDLLEDSFFELNGDLYMGAYHIFSLNGSDVANGLSVGINTTTGNARVAHPSFVNDILDDDTRINKVGMRDTQIELDDLVGNFGVNVYETNVDPVAIIRNEELILLLAEANYQTDPTTALSAINRVRTASNLEPYTGPTDPASLLDELLFQKRYSLYGEGGHRWIDLRRFDRLAELPLDRPGDMIAIQFPTPANENR